jgi:Transposase DDE domain
VRGRDRPLILALRLHLQLSLKVGSGFWFVLPEKSSAGFPVVNSIYGNRRSHSCEPGDRVLAKATRVDNQTGKPIKGRKRFMTFVLRKKRWVVERTVGWLMGYRRLVRDYELLPETSKTLIYLAMIRWRIIDDAP